MAVILTGQPPYVGETFESVRVQAARGRLEDCFARLDASGAEPELVALCKKCLAFEPADRPAHAGIVAQLITAYLASVQERLEQARVERAAVEVRAREERKRRRLARAWRSPSSSWPSALRLWDFGTRATRPVARHAAPTWSARWPPQ